MNNLISIGILLTLINDGKTTTKKLAEKFEVSTKTISRYLLGLISAGVPITCTQGKYGGIEIESKFVLNTNFLTPTEATEICSLIKSSEIISVSKNSKSILDKLSLSLKSLKQPAIGNGIVIDGLGWGTKILTDTKLSFLARACEESNTLIFSYIKRNGQIEKRICEPYTLVLKDGIWYLYALCLVKEDFRLFRCSRISDYKCSGTRFIRKPIDINAKPWNNQKTFGENVAITLEINKKILPDLHDWLSDLQVKTVLNDTIILSGNATYNDGLITRLLSYKNNLIVISPKKIADDISNTCKAISYCYN